MNKTGLVALLATTLLTGACTWVKPSSGGDAVRVAYDGNVSGCRDAGAITVSVADKVGLYHRPELKVRDELETLARNQAADMPADTIIVSEIVDVLPVEVAHGHRFLVRAPRPAAARRADDADGAETYPVH